MADNQWDSTIPTNNRHEGGSPGTIDTRPIAAELDHPIPAEPPIDWTAVLAAVTSPEDKSDELAEVHLQRYDAPSFPGAEAAHFESLQEMCSNHRMETVAYVAGLKKLAAATDAFMDDPSEGTAWTTFDLVKVSCLGLASIALLAIGVFTLSQILLASGLPGFEDPIRRYLFSGVPVGGAFAIKNIGGLLGTDRNLRRFIGFTHVAGVILAVIWASLFVSSFDSGPMSSADDVLAQVLADPGETADTADSGSALLFVGLLAEMFLAGGCWLEIERIVTGHRRARRTLNPLRVAVDSEVTRWANHLVAVTAIEGRLKARLTSIHSGRATYVSRALNHYRLRCRGLTGHDPAASPNDALAGDGQSVARLSPSQPLVTERRPK
jgi:hypothetical protein